MVGAVAVATTIGAGVILPMIVPASLMARPLLYPAILIGAGIGAGIGLQKAGLPTAALGIGLPILTLGGFLMYVGASQVYSKATAPKQNPYFENRSRQRMTGPGMGALASYTPANMGAVFQGSNMGAVLQGSGYGTMAAVEAMIGDSSMRPAYYSRAGAELGAR